MSEMGFEALYWLPYLANLRHRYHLKPDQCITITRGGAGAWYPAGGPRVELYDYVPPRDLRLVALESQQAHASIKQIQITAFEHKLIALIAARLGLRRYGLLHPSRMYRALDPWWRTQEMGFAPMMRYLRIEPMPSLTIPLGMVLPDAFVAMRWYQRPTWPLRPELLEWTHAVVRSVAATIPVVILTSSQYLDDHVDFPCPAGAGVTILPVEPWKENLAIQTAILQRATAFMGTWGGMAQLAVRLGKPTTALYERWHGCSYQHLVFTQWLAVQQGTPLFVGRPMDLDRARTMLPVAVALPDLPRGSSS